MKLDRWSPSLAALLAMLALTSAVARAQGDAPPARAARLGLAIAPLDETWRESNAYQASGLMVVGVDPRGRAASSGIVAGDVLVSVGGRTMREPSDLGRAERSLSPDRAVAIVLARDGGRSRMSVEVAPVGAAPAMAVAPVSAPDAAAVDPEAAPGAPATVTAASSDTAAADRLADPAPPPAVAATAEASVATAPPAAPGQSVPGAGPTEGPRSGTSSAAPSATSAGPAGMQAGAGGEASAPAALSAPAAVGAVSAASVVAGPGASPAPSTAIVDSVATPLEIGEPAPAGLGVVGKSLTPDLATALGASGVEGILVLEVTSASPADRSGLRAGDIILKVGEQPVSDVRELERAAAASSKLVSISTLRLGKPRVELVSLDGPPPVPIAPPSQEQLLMELRDEVRSLRREVQGLRKKLGK